MTRFRNASLGRSGANCGSSCSETTSALARLSESIYSYSLGVSSVFTATGTIDALGELAEGAGSRVVDERDLALAACLEIALDQVVRGVVVAGNVDDGRADGVVSGAVRRHDCSPFCAQLRLRVWLACDTAKSSRPPRSRRFPPAWCPRWQRAA